jgi:Rieske Fe-S protein
MAALEVDLSNISMGQTVTVKWRGKPVFVRRRSEDEIAKANSVDLKSLRDPEADDQRTINPEVLVPPPPRAQNPQTLNPKQWQRWIRNGSARPDAI